MASSSPLKVLTTRFLLSNLHCPSCVTAIEEAFSTLVPKPISVSSSVVSSWVTVRHDASLPFINMLSVLQDGGYEVVSVVSDVTAVAKGVADDDLSGMLGGTSITGLLKQTLSPNSGNSRSDARNETKLETMREKHKQKCDACRSGETSSMKDDKPVSFVGDVSESSDHESHLASTATEHLENLVVIDSGEDEVIWRASFAIGGMTCASCVDTVTKSVEGPEWVKKVSVRLVTASAVVEFLGKEHLKDVMMSLEDTGMEVTLHEMVNLSIQPTVERTVDIKVNGMFCESCPDRIHQSLDSFAGRVHVEKPLTIHNNIIRIRYSPSAPTLTIRKIMDAISNAGAEFEVSIYHPPTLEQLSAKLHRREWRRTSCRTALSVLSAIPTFIIGVVYMSLVPMSNTVRQYLERPWASVSRSQWALCILATPVYFYSAGAFHERALKEVHTLWRRGSKTPLLRRFYRFGSMNMLISLGTSIAYLSSLAELINAATHHNLAVGNDSFYFDTVVFLTMFILIGRLIEAYSKSKTGDAISILGKLRPTEALLVEQDGENSHSTRTLNVDLLDFGDIVRVAQGASPPSDGIIIDGETSFDESSLTGESSLVMKNVGDQVFSGTVNKAGPILIKITGIAGNSMLDQIVNAVREGQTQHASIEKFADSLTGYFVPAIVSVSITTWILWLSLGLSGILPDDYRDNQSGSWVVWSLGFAIAVFVVACPCGIGLAAPTALVVGSGLAAQNGILAKGGGEAFEKASRLDCVVFDKTGTLTVGGEPVVTDSVIRAGIPAEEHITVYSMIHKLEQNSNHPVAKAVTSFCQKQKLQNFDLDNVEEIAGRGMRGLLVATPGQETYMIAGNEALMSENEVQIEASTAEVLTSWKSLGRSVVLVATRATIEDAYKVVASFSVSDPIRPESPGLVKHLQDSGIDVWLLSGDNPMTAGAIGIQVGIPSTNIIAGVLPTQKADQIKYLQKSLSSKSKKRRSLVAMVGDGINDAPALAAADVGIAIGSGSDIAISAADFVLISSDLMTVLTLLDLSRIIFRRIKFNFGWALIYNMIGVPVAAGALYPLRGGSGTHVRLDPVWASLAMALSSVSVVCSSLALRCGVKWIGFVKRGRKGR